MAYNVFICYRGDTGGMLAGNIYGELTAYSKTKIQLFYAPKCIPRGENFKEMCVENAKKVSLMMLVLSPGFFDQCNESDDIVYQEIKAALENPDTQFLPIIMPDFSFKDVDLSGLFSETETHRIKHISAIKFTDVYSFSSSDLLVPILKEKLGFLGYDEAILEEMIKNRGRTKSRIHIGDDGKKEYFSEKNTLETKRLDAQQKLLSDFDTPVYEKYLAGKTSLNVLDIGSSNGKALMSRLGGRSEVNKIIGVEYDGGATEKANEAYASERVRFYKCDVESEDFETELADIMRENGIEYFDWINILAVLAHLKNPYKVLKILKKFCAKGAVIFIRNIDDGLNIAYPDEEMKFERAFSLLSRCDTTGYRKSGREIFTILKKINCKEIRLEKNGLNSVEMDYDGKTAFFDVIFKFIKNGINVTARNNPQSKEIAAECKWFNDNYDKLEEDFQSPEFFMNFGFLIYTAIV